MNDYEPLSFFDETTTLAGTVLKPHAFESKDARATSKEAAHRAFIKSGQRRHTVLQTIAAQREHGATDLELSRILGWDGSSVRPRRIECEHAGLVRDSGKLRETPSKGFATVWVVTALGERALVAADEVLSSVNR